MTAHGFGFAAGGVGQVFRRAHIARRIAQILTNIHAVNGGFGHIQGCLKRVFATVKHRFGQGRRFGFFFQTVKTVSRLRQCNGEHFHHRGGSRSIQGRHIHRQLRLFCRPYRRFSHRFLHRGVIGVLQTQYRQRLQAAVVPYLAAHKTLLVGGSLRTQRRHHFIHTVLPARASIGAHKQGRRRSIGLQFSGFYAKFHSFIS